MNLNKRLLEDIFKMSLPIFDLERAEKHPFIAYNTSIEDLIESKEAWAKLSEITVNNRIAADTDYKKAQQELAFCQEELYQYLQLEKGFPALYDQYPELKDLVIISGPSREELEKECLDLINLKDKACSRYIKACEIATWARLQKDICDAFCEFRVTASYDEVESAIARCKEPARWTIRKMEERASFWNVL